MSAATSIADKPQRLPLNAVVFREDLYPRIQTSAETVQKYAETLEVLPPIEVNQRHELIDGWHRWTAHKKANAENIVVLITKTANDAELLELAIERNATHGLQLSQEDKRDMARRIYHATPERERDQKKKHLAAILSVSERTIREWLSRIDKDSKEARDRKIFEMWMACYTQEEIASTIGCTRDEVRGVSESFGEIGKLAENPKAQASHATDFETPLLQQIWTEPETDWFRMSPQQYADWLVSLRRRIAEKVVPQKRYPYPPVNRWSATADVQPLWPGTKWESIRQRKE